MAQCPTCGALVPTIFEHVDRDDCSIEPIDWNSSADVRKAVAAGILPHGYSLNAAGALVVPGYAPAALARGSAVLLAMFDEVVTASGQIIKSRNGDVGRAG